MFINAIEESAQNRPVHTPVAAKQIKGEAELRKFIQCVVKPLALAMGIKDTSIKFTQVFEDGTKYSCIRF